MKYQYILFDLDGTLTDSGEGIMNSGRYALEQLGLVIPEEAQLRKMVGPPLRTSFPLFGVPEDQVEEAIRLYRDRYNHQGGKYQNSVYPGIETLLGELYASGCKLYVATSKPENLAREILRHFQLDRFFEYIAGATEDHARETKSDVLKYLLEITQNTESTVMVGDTKYDVTGAQEQGLPCIGVSWGYGTAGELRSAGAAALVDTPEELLDCLKG